MQIKNDDLFSPPFMSPVIFTADVCKEREEPADDHFFPLVYIKSLRFFNLRQRLELH